MYINIFEVRKAGWRIWYFQNLLLFIPFILLIPNFKALNAGAHLGLYSGFWDIGTLINVIFYFTLFLDLLAVLLICISVGFESFLHRRENYSSFIILIPFFGILWILTTFFWRFPFYCRNPFNFGFGIRRPVFPLENSIYMEFFINPLMICLLLCSSFIMLLFLILQDNLLLFKKQTFGSNQQLVIDLGTIFGLANCFSNFLIFLIINSGVNIGEFPSYPPIQFLLMFICWIFKLLLVPLLGMRTTRRYISCTGITPSNEIPPSVSNYKDKFILWFKSRKHVCQPVKMRPSKRISGIIVILMFLLFTQPISPFFLRNAFLSPYIEGPYITRNANSDTIGILQYVENLPLTEITGISNEEGGFYKFHLMTNSTLKFFLNQIANKPPIRLSSSPTYYYYLCWSVSLIESSSLILNSTEFSSYWKNVSKYDPDFLIWWDNRSDLVTKWIFLGSFEYKQIAGPMSGHFIRASQVIFLNTDLEIICFAFYQSHYVS